MDKLIFVTNINLIGLVIMTPSCYLSNYEVTCKNDLKSNKDLPYIF